MSNYHVLTTNAPDSEIRVAFHLAIPDTTNSAGVNYRTALLQSGMASGTPDSAVPWLTTEQADLDSGALYELVETVQVDGSLTKAAKRDIVDARYTALAAKVPGKIQAELDWWGTDRDVP
jgi:hypothetical protein